MTNREAGVGGCSVHQKRETKKKSCSFLVALVCIRYLLKHLLVYSSIFDHSEVSYFYKTHNFYQTYLNSSSNFWFNLLKSPFIWHLLNKQAFSLMTGDTFFVWFCSLRVTKPLCTPLFLTRSRRQAIDHLAGRQRRLGNVGRHSGYPPSTYPVKLPKWEARSNATSTPPPVPPRTSRWKRCIQEMFL